MNHPQPGAGGEEDLLRQCQGEVVWPGDERYAAVCAGWNLCWTQSPAVAVRPLVEDDVVHAVRYAAAHGLAVAVQATGHGVVVPSDERALLLAMDGLDSFSIDAERREVTVGGGAKWAAVLEAAHGSGLAPLIGSTPHVGAVGYSLGGGFGWLGRGHGLAVDAVRSLRVVLADGTAVTTSPENEPDLFWALCGTSGSALGVVVEMTAALAPVSEVYGGNLFYPLDSAREVFERYREWAADAPDELTTAFNITNFPPLEEIPEPLRGQAFVIVRGCYSGPDPDEGRRLIDEWRNWRAPLMDMWTTMPFMASAQISMDPVDPAPGRASGRWITGLDEVVLTSMLEAVGGGDGPSPMLLAEARHAGGAMSRPNPAMSFAARDAGFALEFAGMVAFPGAEVELERRITQAWGRLGPVLAPVPGFLNFNEGPEKVLVTAQSFDADTMERLTRVKHHYDPENLFRYGVPLGSAG
ncbi:FAD-binding oxidoreductase [Dietzia sp. 179-F 9C3 NHS]|uniref:FAD-binding oxidoreductase n=1 Tax=Dietzia sp. 179-F 9C3 NHS TaxID=3374295 RepID=UPI003879A30F